MLKYLLYLGGQLGEVSEWFKELVLKTSDSKEPWVRIPPSPPSVLFGLQKYPSGRRGSPAKGVGG